MKTNDRKGLYAHKTGDIKIAPGTQGINVLPDGSVAITKAALRDAVKLSEAAQR